MSLSEESTKKIADALLAGRKIEAIKLYRSETGESLTEAKAFVDNLTNELKQEFPDKFKTQAKGCMIYIVIGVLGTGLAGYQIVDWIS